MLWRELSTMLLSFWVYLALHVMRYILLFMDCSSQVYLICMCMHSYVQYSKVLVSEFHRTHIALCLHIATAIEQHTPTDMLNTFKRLNNLYPGPKRCFIMNKSIIDETCVSRNQLLQLACYQLILEMQLHCVHA